MTLARIARALGPRMPDIGGYKEGRQPYSYTINTSRERSFAGTTYTVPDPWMKFRLKVTQVAGNKLSSAGIPFTVTQDQDQKSLYKIETIREGERAVEKVMYAHDMHLLSDLFSDHPMTPTTTDPLGQINRVKNWSKGVKLGVYRAMLLEEAAFWKDSAAEDRSVADALEQSAPVSGHLLGIQSLPIHAVTDETYYLKSVTADSYQRKADELLGKAEKLRQQGAVDITEALVAELIHSAVERELGSGKYGRRLRRTASSLQQTAA